METDNDSPGALCEKTWTSITNYMDQSVSWFIPSVLNQCGAKQGQFQSSNDFATLKTGVNKPGPAQDGTISKAQN